MVHARWGTARFPANAPGNLSIAPGWDARSPLRSFRFQDAAAHERFDGTGTGNADGFYRDDEVVADDKALMVDFAKKDLGGWSAYSAICCTITITLRDGLMECKS